jgi:hypothetical protein
VTRTAELEARRRTLLARCEAQRAELAQRMEQLRRRGPAATLAAGARGDAHPRHPLAWIAALAALLLLGRTRQALKFLGWARAALTLAARAAQLLSLIRGLRTRHAGEARGGRAAVPAAEPLNRGG